MMWILVVLGERNEMMKGDNPSVGVTSLNQSLEEYWNWSAKRISLSLEESNLKFLTL